MTDRERLPRSHRLVRGPDVHLVLRSGRRARRAHLDIFWTPSEAGHSRLGLIVPRFQHSAVARNRLRRRLKDLWRRELRPGLPASDVVFRARKESYGASFATLRAELTGWVATLQP
ncbi:MAG: ribonuclease P protein component [Gemmatimonadota bacterium]